MSTLTLRRADPKDAGLLVEMIRELAAYEKLSDEVEADEGALASHLARDASPRCEAVIAEGENGEPLGFALYYWSYSTFLTSWGIYLEDLFVREAHRGNGIGLQLLGWLAHETVDRGGSRLTWQVLDWNAPALGFYEKLGAQALREWQPMRLDGQALEDLAAGYSGTI
ncbi:MAG: GNAT superfamily N-acetyltransferase [Rhodothermales bacterium]|jgi:GNAT superfamily N-acetyltransferase